MALASISTSLYPAFTKQLLEYANDEVAMKTGTNEKKGIASYFLCDIPGLCYPLICLIHYRGFLLLASSLIDAINSTTLKYGSNDSGKTVHKDDQTLNSLMETAGKMLNLADHNVGGQRIYGPGDIEGHLGTDKLYYVLDFGRVLPPTKGRPYARKY